MNVMRNKIIRVFILILSVITFSLTAFAGECYNSGMLKAGISMIENVPNYLWGTWRISSVLMNTNNPAKFKKSTTDIWNLYKENDVIILKNPFTQATASVTVSYVKGNVIKFERRDAIDNETLIDTVEIVINENDFIGTNTIILDNGKTVYTATYKLKGNKIAGTSIGE